MSTRSIRGLAALVAVVGTAVTLVGIVLAVRAVRAERETARIQGGPRVLAVIVATGRVSGRHQRVTLRYADRSGRRDELDVLYPLGLAHDVIAGMSTSVAYDPRHPARAELAGHPRHRWQDVAIAAALTALVTGGWLRWLLALLLAARREEEQPEIRLGAPGEVERGPPARVARLRHPHLYGTLGVLVVLLLVGGRLLTQLVAFDSPQEVGFPPLPVLPQHRGPVVVPSVLSARPPSSGPLVTPREAGVIAAAAWQFRDRALAQHDVAELRAIDAEPALTVDIEDLKAGFAPHRPVPVPGDLHDLTAFTPRQTRWPLRLLAEAVTTSAGGPVLEVMVLTRAAPGASWRVALDNVVGATSRYTPAIDPPILDAAGYDLVPTLHWIAPRAVVPALARYWQSMRETGRPPDGGVTFAPGYWTTDYGSSIGDKQDTRDRNGLPAHVVYGDRPAPPGEVWTFGVYRDWTMVCSPMHETKTWTGPAHQDRNRQKWGADLAPGVYRTITSEFVRELCTVVPPASGPPGVVVFGADARGIATRGSR